LKNDLPIYQQIICANSRIILSCPTNRYIYIYRAYYGIQSETSTNTNCLPNSQSNTRPSVCYNKDAFDRLSSQCNSKQECLIYVDDNNFGNPCVVQDLSIIILKQMFIQYQCLEETMINQIESSCPINTVIESNCPIIDDTYQTAMGSDLIQEKLWYVYIKK
jgi:hypothetical protein